jgi:hypothetical protein
VSYRAAYTYEPIPGLTFYSMYATAYDPAGAAGGVYICEDLHAAYSPAFDGGYRRSGTFIEVAKQIVDDIHADFHDQPQSVPGAHRSIHGICFYNSMVVIEKRLQQEPRHVQVGP